MTSLSLLEQHVGAMRHGPPRDCRPSVPRLRTATVRPSATVPCQRASSGKSISQGPQSGETKTSATGRPRARSALERDRRSMHAGKGEGRGRSRRSADPGGKAARCSCSLGQSAAQGAALAARAGRRSPARSRASAPQVDGDKLRGGPVGDPGVDRRSGPTPRDNAAGTASAALRASVLRPAGAECSCPKQWQSGAWPRASAAAMPAMKARSRTSAATPPHWAEGRATRAAAVATRPGAGGSRRQPAPARERRTPPVPCGSPDDREAWPHPR